MNVFKKAWIHIRFVLSWAVWNPIRSRLAVWCGALLMRGGLAVAEAGVRALLWYDDQIAWGCLKFAHKHSWSEEWYENAAEVVDRARRLQEKLHGKRRQSHAFARRILAEVMGPTK